MLNENRRTGRTTRMMEEAKALAQAGKAVYVVATTPILQKYIEDDETLRLGIKFESISSLSNLDWLALRLRGAHPNCVVLVDHYAIETYFSRVLEMLHRYDKEKPNAE